jgi:hypothetical protein
MRSGINWDGFHCSEGLFFKTERIAGTNGISQLRSWASETTLLTYTIVWFFTPFLEANILLRLNITNLQLYIRI